MTVPETGMTLEVKIVISSGTGLIAMVVTVTTHQCYIAERQELTGRDVCIPHKFEIFTGISQTFSQGRAAPARGRSYVDPVNLELITIKYPVM